MARTRPLITANENAITSGNEPIVIAFRAGILLGAVKNADDLDESG
ncbi:hypothetical protein [Saccharopolyspora phatthalungensis]|uniref:Uncharacterized protein n=1 Tax=Saccharopolyspora phatthalungensis TaxID=664693 RepID=A0A840PXK0_9PSEU|nr:hypothetical protein [Saccharopolyspora phatthalungensis]MBB5152490.1 hypothetical protein [Saccharopolyspora phatthalungensis]